MKAKFKVGDLVKNKRTGGTFRIGFITTKGEWLEYATMLKTTDEEIWYSDGNSMEDIERSGYCLENELEKI